MDYILTHHGIKGQKWGVRRFQNSDGTRTNAGKKRYSKFDRQRNQITDIVDSSKNKTDNKLARLSEKKEYCFF